MAPPVHLRTVGVLVKELETAARDRRPIVIGGASELAPILQRQLLRGGDPAAVRVGDPEGGAVYVHIRAEPTGDEALKRAHRARVPIVVLSSELAPVPYVFASDILLLAPGAGFPVDRITEAIARKLGEDATGLAARLPVLRSAVCERLVTRTARRNAVIAAAIFVPGADLPVLALSQLRLLLRIAVAHGQELGADRLPEVATTLGAGFGFRAIARGLLDLLPVAGWAVQGAVAYTGTRALGEAAVRWFAVRGPAEERAGATRRPGGA